jgi:hypothetical protein
MDWRWPAPSQGYHPSSQVTGSTMRLTSRPRDVHVGGGDALRDVNLRNGVQMD